MSKESEHGRRLPCVIAKLMGLDGLPAQRNTDNQQKRHSGRDRADCSSAGFLEFDEMYDRQSSRERGKGRMKSRDVSEVSDRSVREARSVTSPGTSYRTPNEDGIAFVRQKSMDVNCTPADHKLQHSREFRYAFEVLDSNKDLLRKFLHEPDALFTKHLDRLQGAHDSRCGHALGIKSSNTLKCNDVPGSHPGGEASQRIDIRNPRKSWDKYHCDNGHRRKVNLDELNLSAEVKKAANCDHMRIVVLKPNLRKACYKGRSSSSTSPSQDAAFSIFNTESNEEHPKTRGKRSKHDEFDVPVRKSLESRVIAREITFQMRNKCGVDSTVSSSGYEAYSADESSHNMSDNDMSYDSEVMVPNFQTVSDRSVRKKSFAVHHMESSVNVEAKKRLSERWRMTRRSQYAGTSGKGSTLAEMLSVPDVDLRPQNHDNFAAQNVCSSIIGSDGGANDQSTPLGISSRDGWKDACVQNLQRSRSLPFFSNQSVTLKPSTRHEAIATERFVIREKSSGHECFKRDSKREVGSFSESTTSRNKDQVSTFPETVTVSEDVQTGKNMSKFSIYGTESSDGKALIPKMPSIRLDTTSACKEHKYVTKSLNHADERVPPAKNSSVLPLYDSCNSDVSSAYQKHSSTCDLGGSSYFQYASRPESLASSKESEQPSPVSILDAPFVEEPTSGSECFEGVSAKLHGLRMQLQLLKQESEDYDGGPMLHSSDKGGETPVFDDEGFHCIGENWESSYFADVLTYSGLDDTGSDEFIASWHNSDCPVGLWVFEKMEDKYGGCGSCLRSERKLLFDRINAAIIQLSQQYVDNMGLCLKPLIKGVCHARWSKHGFRTDLYNLLKYSEEKVIESAMGEVEVNSIMQWFKLKLEDNKCFVACDIEQLLIDDLVAELCPF